MKFWKKFKIRFKKNKVYRMYIILAAGCSIGAIIFGVLAGFQKDEIDEKEKSGEKDFQNEVLKSTKKTELNTDCNRFFEEHIEFERFSSFFEHGYLVIRQDDDGHLCKKSYGEKSYTDFSTFKLYKENGKYYFNYKFDFVQNYFLDGGVIANNILDDTKIDFNNLNKPQRIWGFIDHNTNMVNALLIIKNTKPYTYAFGIINRKHTANTSQK